MSNPSILFYDPASAPWSGKLKTICAIQGIKLRRVENDRLDRPLFSLLSGEGGEGQGQAEPLPEPVMIFCRMTEPQLDRILPALRKERIFCLKAVLTPTNAGWSLRQLYEELCREREQMGVHSPEKSK